MSCYSCSFMFQSHACRGKGTNLKSRAAQVHSAFFHVAPRRAASVQVEGKFGFVKSSRNFYGSCPSPLWGDVRPPNLTILSFFLFESGFSEDHAPKTIYKQKLSLHLYTSIHFFRPYKIPHHLLDSFGTSNVAKSTQNPNKVNGVSCFPL